MPSPGRRGRLTPGLTRRTRGCRPARSTISPPITTKGCSPRSNSLPPLFEAFYHRIAEHRIRSLRFAGQERSPHDAKSVNVLRTLLSNLYALLGRARTVLLDGPPGRVLAWLKAVQDEVEVLPDDDVRRRRSR